MNALIIVDVQNDFLPGGALGVAEGDQVIEPIIEMAYKAQVSDDELDPAVVITTQDRHPHDTAHFDGVRGTEGVELGNQRLADLADFAVFKGEGNTDGYSGFEGETTHGEPLDK